MLSLDVAGNIAEYRICSSKESCQNNITSSLFSVFSFGSVGSGADAKVWQQVSVIGSTGRQFLTKAES